MGIGVIGALEEQGQVLFGVPTATALVDGGYASSGYYELGTLTYDVRFWGNSSSAVLINPARTRAESAHSSYPTSTRSVSVASNQRDGWVVRNQGASLRTSVNTGIRGYSDLRKIGSFFYGVLGTKLYRGSTLENMAEVASASFSLNFILEGAANQIVAMPKDNSGLSYLYSTDGGATWAVRVDALATNNYVNSGMTYHPSTGEYFVGGYDSNNNYYTYFWKASSLGGGWNQAWSTSNAQYNGVSFIASVNGVLFAYSNTSFIWYSTNNGSSFSYNGQPANMTSVNGMYAQGNIAYIYGRDTNNYPAIAHANVTSFNNFPGWTRDFSLFCSNQLQVGQAGYNSSSSSNVTTNSNLNSIGSGSVNYMQLINGQWFISVSGNANTSYYESVNVGVISTLTNPSLPLGGISGSKYFASSQYNGMARPTFLYDSDNDRYVSIPATSSEYAMIAVGSLDNFMVAPTYQGGIIFYAYSSALKELN